jgi:hypothetical protein
VPCDRPFVRANTRADGKKDVTVRPNAESTTGHEGSGQDAGIRTVAAPVHRASGQQPTGGGPVGMLRKLVASGVAAKVVQELQKPQNQAKIKQFIRDYQAKNKRGGGGAAGRY